MRLVPKHPANMFLINAQDSFTHIQNNR